MKRAKALIATIGFGILLLCTAGLGQVTLIDSPFIYKSAENFADCTAPPNTGCFIDDEITYSATPPIARTLSIRIRFPIGATGSRPMILWSHGGGTAENGHTQSPDWGRTFARAGYIVIHLSHPPGTQLGERELMCVEFAVNPGSQECNDFPVLSVWRARDANAVLARLNTIEQRHPEINIDRNNIAVAGWSYGSYTPLALADARFYFSPTADDVSFANPLPKVFVAMSPQGPGNYGYVDDTWREIHRPVLLATGPGEIDSVERRLVPFQSMPPGRKYQLYIDHPDSIHATFNLGNDEHPEFSQWLASYTLAFLDAYLKNRTIAQAYLISTRLPLQGSRKTVRISRK